MKYNYLVLPETSLSVFAASAVSHSNGMVLIWVLGEGLSSVDDNGYLIGLRALCVLWGLCHRWHQRSRPSCWVVLTFFFCLVFFVLWWGVTSKDLFVPNRFPKLGYWEAQLSGDMLIGSCITPYVIQTMASHHWSFHTSLFLPSNQLASTINPFPAKTDSVC